MKYRIHLGQTKKLNSVLPDGESEETISSLFSGKKKMKEVKEQLEFKVSRKLSSTGLYKALPLSKVPGLGVFYTEVKKIIESKQGNTVCVAVMAPWKEEETLSAKEGYLRRVKEIDETVLDECFCIYLYECPYYKPFVITVDYLSENRLYVRYNANIRAHREFVEQLIGLCDLCYSHSILRLVPVTNPENDNNWLNIFNRGTKHILDIHGATVSEAKMRGEIDIIPWLEKAEAMYFANIDAAVSLTEHMEQYFCEKYKRENIIFYRTPVISQDISAESCSNYNKKEITVYSGGCQIWQNVPLMIKAIKEGPKHLIYKIYVSEPESFITAWGKDPISGNVMIKKGNPEEIKSTYRKARYGFILRDDNVLNKVACPTKLMEYIQFGIIPIFKSEEIGDFKQLGLCFLSVDQYVAGQLPPDDERKRMVQNNLQIAEKLRLLYKQEIARLRQSIAGVIQ